MIKNKLYWIVTLCCLAWGTTLYAQDKVLRFERTLLLTPSLTGKNPALLQHLTDSILFNAKINYAFDKGDFVNYYQPNQNYKLGAGTGSYNRINQKMVVYGYADYSYFKGKNSNGTSFFDPYRTPFNFTPKDNTTKGDNRIEQYHLSGALSYNIARKWHVGTKIDYKTISFVKLKDMRNINTILDLTASVGTSYRFNTNHTLAFCYNYNRYIENMRINEYGNLEKDYYALINKGSFMGLLHLYGDDGILDTGNNRPWVDIVHNLGIQYHVNINSTVSAFFELNYKTGKGHYGNDSDNAVVYMRHDKNGYDLNAQLQIKKENTTHILKINGNRAEITNKEQLYEQVSTPKGDYVMEYYGSRELFHRKKTTAGIGYTLLWGDAAKNAPWQLNTEYKFSATNRKTSLFPYFRKQNIKCHNINAEIGRAFRYKKNNLWLKYTAGFTAGSGGNPIDGMYVDSSGSTVPPDYLNDYLHREREYLTAKRLLSAITFRIGRDYKNKEVYIQLNAAYIKSLKTEYVKGDFLSLDMAIGLAF